MGARGVGGRRAVITLLSVVAILAAACGSGDSENSAPDDTTGGEPRTIEVPAEYATIQEAVDAASPGDLVLVEAGVYEESVDVQVENLTIRGVDRNEVVLEGGFELDNGIRVLETDGVAIENMTARNYTGNGFFWSGVDGYRGSYLTAYRNGDYGLYAFDSVNGLFEHSLGSGSPDAGVYIGQCYPCHAVIDNVISEYNGLGYSGTDSGGELYIVNSTFRHNRAGIVPNSGSYELCYPGRETTVVGNLVHDNNGLDNPAIAVALMAHGNGILVAGGVRNTIERNRVWNHDRTGIALVPYPEEDASDLAPPPEEWTTPCEDTKDITPEIAEEDCRSVDGLLEGCAVLWNPFENRVVGNVVQNSGLADIAVGTIDLFGDGVTTETLDNCFSDNTFASSAPAELEQLAPCDGTPSATGWDVSPLDLLTLMMDQPAKPPADAYHRTPVPSPQPSMPDARTAPARAATDVPPAVDIDAITVPPAPE